MAAKLNTAVDLTHVPFALSAGAVLFVSFALGPQVVTNARARATGGLSIAMVAMMLTARAVWASSVFYYGQHLLFFVQHCVFAAFALAVVTQHVSYETEASRPRVVAFAVGATVGTLALGTGAYFLITAGDAPQESIRSRFTWAVNVVLAFPPLSLGVAYATQVGVVILRRSGAGVSLVFVSMDLVAAGLSIASLFLEEAQAGGASGTSGSSASAGFDLSRTYGAIPFLIIAGFQVLLAAVLLSCHAYGHRGDILTTERRTAHTAALKKIDYKRAAGVGLPGSPDFHPRQAWGADGDRGGGDWDGSGSDDPFGKRDPWGGAWDGFDVHARSVHSGGRRSGSQFGSGSYCDSDEYETDFGTSSSSRLAGDAGDDPLARVALQREDSDDAGSDM